MSRFEGNSVTDRITTVVDDVFRTSSSRFTVESTTSNSATALIPGSNPATRSKFKKRRLNRRGQVHRGSSKREVRAHEIIAENYPTVLASHTVSLGPSGREKKKKNRPFG
ncbi:hypothetical protein PUN28_017719 [Cardiocondyla obscurior]|uniref:Uncharacterized protein n=1 Tax=Cardiocondyla obscurior TaxID=286306 RepID=A0AAW2EIR9_9HYME